MLLLSPMWAQVLTFCAFCGSIFNSYSKYLLVRADSRQLSEMEFLPDTEQNLSGPLEIPDERKMKYGRSHASNLSLNVQPYSHSRKGNITRFLSFLLQIGNNE